MLSTGIGRWPPKLLVRAVKRFTRTYIMQKVSFLFEYLPLHKLSFIVCSEDHASSSSLCDPYPSPDVPAVHALGPAQTPNPPKLRNSSLKQVTRKLQELAPELYAGSTVER